MAEDNDINAMIAVEILNQMVFDGEEPETGQVGRIAGKNELSVNPDSPFIIGIYL